jgi:tetratricopeptide (TPR) repeat protein
MNDEEKEKQAKEYFKQGNAYYRKGDYDRAIEDYTKAIALKPDYAATYNNRGVTYSNKGEYDKAIEDYNKAIELKPDYAYAYNSRGIVYGVKGDYDKAIEDFTKAIELKPDYAEIYNNRGITYADKGEYGKAIEDYTKAIELKPDYAGVYNNRGNAYYKKGKYDKAIEDYNKAIELKPDFTAVYNNRGNAYYKKGDYDRAIEDFNKAIELKPDNYFSSTMRKYKVENADPNYTVYKAIYDRSYVIMRLLHVSNNEETENGFAHYTRKDIAEKLLIKAEGKVSPFRLNSIVTSNDPTEGKIVFDYLGLENKETNRDYQAFIACFTFDSECLNQFRLYGKEQGQEATGVSLVFNKRFFAEEPTQIVSKNLRRGQDDKTVVQAEETAIDKYALYRCVYIDLKTKQIIALGHKDDYTFFRGYSEVDEAKQNEIREKIDKYKEDINKKLEAVRKQFEALKKYIDDAKKKNGIKEQTVCDLLMNLRYLIKHIAFKEEQECRIVQVEALANHDKVTLEGDKMFIKTQAVGGFIDKICFAPNAVGMEFFQEKLIYNGTEIPCYQCEHPIRVTKS